MTSICLNINKEKTNVILGEKVVTLWGQPYITDSIGDIKYQISPLSFYQVNPVQTKILYETALAYADLHGEETVWDLYCGIGTISLFIAQRARQVYGVEIIPQAIEDARRNAEINQIENAEFFVGAAEEVLPRMYQENSVYADVIVVDPPRKGCEESLLDTIIQMSPKRVVYVSCDPATLARDLRFICDRGYRLEKVQAVDQFGHSVHVETVCLLSRKSTVYV
jgi:23S rRNA (uracil1939-C5)-methyltransferase